MISKTIEIADSDILYDVNFISWKTAKCRITEPEAQSEAQTDDESLKWFYTQRDAAISSLKGMLRWCLADSDTDFHFQFSDAWKGSFDALQSHIHRYIVDYILSEWFKMTLPNEAAAYLTSAAASLDKVLYEARSEDVRNIFFRL